MKTLALLAIFATARPGYQFEFPRDHWSHPEFKTEWWYWTGNLRAADGRRFGFELTFFRQASSPEAARGVWDPRDLYLAHLTLSDVQGAKFHRYERINRAGPGLAGANGRVWNGNWEAGLDFLRAVTPEFRIGLKLRAVKPPVIHGANGISQKAEGEGRASHYVSFTRIEASGEIELGGRAIPVTGTAWMDHEFFTHQLEPDQVGWDWMSIQLDDGSDLMLFRLRRRDGTVDRYSAGTYVDAAGRARPLRREDFTLTPLDTWKSPSTGASYPVRWKIAAPVLGLDLTASTPLAGQELSGKSRFSPVYWEGAMDFSGVSGGRPVRGVGYLEMTGYDKPVSF